MSKLNTEKIVPRLHTNFIATTKLFNDILESDDKLVSEEIKRKAIMRRLRISFLALYEYFKEASKLPEEYAQKPLDEGTDYFIKQGVLSADDKDNFLLLGSVYTAIRWSGPGGSPNEVKIMEQVPKVFEFLSKMAQTDVKVPQAE